LTFIVAFEVDGVIVDLMITAQPRPRLM